MDERRTPELPAQSDNSTCCYIHRPLNHRRFVSLNQPSSVQQCEKSWADQSVVYCLINLAWTPLGRRKCLTYTNRAASAALEQLQAGRISGREFMNNILIIQRYGVSRRSPQTRYNLKPSTRTSACSVHMHVRSACARALCRCWHHRMSEKRAFLSD